MTTILDLPVYGFDITAQVNEDLLLSLAYVDDQITGVTIYNGGTAFGGTTFTGTLPVYFSPPVSGTGVPALGTATIQNGVILSIALNYNGQGYAAQESVELTIPGNGSGLVVGVNIGNPLTLDGIIIDFEVRPAASDGTTSPVVTIFATNHPIKGVTADGVVTTASNTLNLSIPESVMFTKSIGACLYEFRAQADGAVRVIAKGNFALSQGVAYERG